MAGWQETAPGIWAYYGDDGTPEQPPPGESPPGGSGYGSLAGSEAQGPAPGTPTSPASGAPGPATVPYDPAAAYVPAGLDSYQTSGSTSYTGTPKAAVGEFDANVKTGAAQAESDVNARASEDALRLWEASLASQRAIIGDEAYAQAPSRFDVERGVAEENTRQQARLAEYQSRLIQTEQVAQAAAEKHVAQVGAEYMGQVQQFAAMRVNPGQWWANLSQGEQAGTLASVFVANFLGMRGRNTTVMATIDRAIDQNIDAQAQNIQQAGQVAGMYKTMYDMAVSQSATAEEARARMRGLHIAQLQQDIAVELGRYDAPLAQAKAAEARAALDTMFAKNFADLNATWYDKGMTAKQQVIETERARLNAQQVSSAKSYGQSAGRAEPRAGGVDPRIKDFNERVITDPITGEVLGAARTKEDGQRVRQENSAAYAIGSLAKDVRDMIQVVGSQYGGDWGARFKPEDQRRVDALVSRLKQAVTLRTTGKALNATEQKLVDMQTPKDTWFTNGGIVEIYNDFIKREVADAKFDWAGQASEMTAEERSWVDQGLVAPGLMSAKPMAAYEAAANEDKPEETPSVKAQKTYKGKDSNDLVTVPAGSLAGKAYQEALGQGTFDDPDAESRVPEWFLGLYELATTNPEEAAVALEGIERELNVESGDKPGVAVRRAAVARIRQELAKPVSSPGDDDRETVGGY